MDSASDEEYRERTDKSVEEKEWKKLRDRRVTDGYKEGYSAGQEETLQQGFDEGYMLSVQIAFKIAKMRGNLCAHLCQEEIDQTDSPKSSTAEAQNLIEKLSALEESLTKARTDPKFSEVSQTADVSEEKARSDKSCECEKSSETDCKTQDGGCCAGACSCISGDGDNITQACSEGMKGVQDQMKHLTTLYEEVVTKWNKTT